MSNTKRTANNAPWIAAALMMAALPAVAGESRGSMMVRVQVIDPCEAGAAVSANAVSCGTTESGSFAPDAGSPKVTDRASSNSSAIAIHTDRTNGLRTIVF